MKSYLKTKDYSVTEEEFELVYDHTLQMLITKPEPQDLEKYYESENYISHTDASKSFVDKIYQVVKKYSLWKKARLVRKFCPEGKTLLDIGAGTGDFLITVKNKGWEISGVEPNYDAKMRAQEKGINLNSNIDLLSENKYDVITLWHVLEHLPNLEEQIEKIIALLNENGVLIIAVPNFNSFDAKYYKNYWAAFDVPRHLWHFSKNTIKLLFANHGWKVVHTKPMVFDAFYVSLLSEKYKTGKQNYFKALMMGMRSNLKSLSTKESSSQIYILKKE